MEINQHKKSTKSVPIELYQDFEIQFCGVLLIHARHTKPHTLCN